MDLDIPRRPWRGEASSSPEWDSGNTQTDTGKDRKCPPFSQAALHISSGGGSQSEAQRWVDWTKNRPTAEAAPQVLPNSWKHQRKILCAEVRKRTGGGKQTSAQRSGDLSADDERWQSGPAILDFLPAADVGRRVRDGER